MRFRILGPLEVRDGEDWQGIGAAKWRSLLAALLIHHEQIVSVDTLVSEIWGDVPPSRAENLLSGYVLRLRRLLGDADNQLLVTRAPGYQLRVTPSGTDALLFETLVREARSTFTAGDSRGAADKLTEALALWRGRTLADVPPTPLIVAEAQRLNELRLGATELRITAEFVGGDYDHAVVELRSLLTDHPLRERLWLLLMRALDGGGRHAEALEAYQQAQIAISGQLGVDPGSELREFHASLLRKDATNRRGSISARTVASQAPKLEPGFSWGILEGAGLRSTDHVSAPPPLPAQLPTDIADFTGRAEQVQRLCDLLSDEDEDVVDYPSAVRIAVVFGPGGLGKTSLAVHVAHRIRGQFPDGQLYIDLLGASPDQLRAPDVLARFLRDLGGDVPKDEAERAARYRSTLAQHRMLIVLDNARDAAQVRPLLPGSASSAVLVTTRSPMPDLVGSKHIDLNVLGEDEALKLFVTIVGQDRVTAEPKAATDVLDACAGLPLAVRICAMRLAENPSWLIRSMADRLRDEEHRLEELCVGDLSVRASLPEGLDSLRSLTGLHGVGRATNSPRLRPDVLVASGAPAGIATSASRVALRSGHSTVDLREGIPDANLGLLCLAADDPAIREEQQKANGRESSTASESQRTSPRKVAARTRSVNVACGDVIGDGGFLRVSETLLAAIRTMLMAYGIVERKQVIAFFEALIHSWPGEISMLPQILNSEADASATPLAGGRTMPDAVGYELRPDPLTARTAADLVKALTKFREWAGKPSFREMERRCSREIAYTTIHAALGSDKLPSLKVVLAIVAACGGDEEQKRAFATAWRMLSKAQ